MSKSGSAENQNNSGERGLNIKEDWYQTESQIIFVLLVKNVNQSKVNISFKEKSLLVSFELNDGQLFSREILLAHRVNVSMCSFKIFSTKIEIKMGKAEGIHWNKLESEKEKKEVKMTTSKWDKMASEIEDEQPEGDAALNALFQKIYREGSDEVKKAMNKSFLESGGTELNTNWDAVKKDKVSIKPPEGMEWKSWEN